MDSEESTGSVELKKILDSFEAGDVLPEADIVCNILDKLGRNLDLASMLLHFTEFQKVVNLSVFVCFGRRGRQIRNCLTLLTPEQEAYLMLMSESRELLVAVLCHCLMLFVNMSRTEISVSG